MRIGELSDATGVSTRSLRYYEQQGLIQSDRLGNGYRDYAPEVVGAVEFIQDLYAAGLSSQMLRDIMPCVAGGGAQGACGDVVARVRRVRDDLVEQERRIRARRETLEQYLDGSRSPRGSRGVAADSVAVSG